MASAATVVNAGAELDDERWRYVVLRRVADWIRKLEARTQPAG